MPFESRGADTLGPVTTHAVRRLVTAATAIATLTATSVLLAGPASADVPQEWPDVDPVDPIHVILVLVGIPALLFVVIVALVYLPALIRGEDVKPGGATAEDQWLGGPRREPGELAGPDTEESAAGGAGARW